MVAMILQGIYSERVLKRDNTIDPIVCVKEESLIHFPA